MSDELIQIIVQLLSPLLTAAVPTLILWPKLRDQKKKVVSASKMGLAAVADVKDARNELRKLGESYDRVSDQLMAKDNMLSVMEGVVSKQVDSERIGIAYLAEKLDVKYSKAYAMAKRSESPFTLENVPSVGKRWQAKAGAVQDWIGR